MKTTKKFLSIILAILMLATSVPVAFAADTTLTVGDQFEADLTKQGSDNLTFRYIFKVLSLPDAENEYGKLELVSPAEGVYPTVLKIAMLTPKITYGGVTFEITSIGDRAFSRYHNYEYGRELTEINLTLGTVENIGDHAFYQCRKLETANLSPYVDKLVIGMEAFDGCYSITSLQIEAGGGGTVEIGQSAFRDLDSLNELNIGYTISKIGLGAFLDCDALTTVTIAKGALTEIPGWCFSDSEALENIIIPEGITTIGEAAFLDCSSLKNIDFPESLETIYGGAFDSCDSLNSISIPANVSYLGSFHYCSIRRIVFEGGEVPELDGASPLLLLTVEDGFGDGLYASGEEITITANEKEGYEFVKWEIAEGDGTLADASVAETIYTMGSSTATLRPVYEKSLTECQKNGHDWSNGNGVCARCGEKAFEPINGMYVDSSNGMLYGFSAGTPSLDSYSKITADGCVWEYARCENGFGTGTQAILKCGSDIVVQYTVLIFGDVNGDGWYNGEDAFLVNLISNGMLGRTDVGEAVWSAADCNRDGEITEADFELLVSAGLLFESIDQSAANVALEENSAHTEYMLLIDQSAEISLNSVEGDTAAADDTGISSDSAESTAPVETVLDGMLVAVKRILSVLFSLFIEIF